MRDVSWFSFSAFLLVLQVLIVVYQITHDSLTEKEPNDVIAPTDVPSYVSPSPIQGQVLRLKEPNDVIAPTDVPPYVAPSPFQGQVLRLKETEQPLSLSANVTYATFGNCGKKCININLETGEVEYKGFATVDEATVAFWEALPFSVKNMQGKCDE